MSLDVLINRFLDDRAALEPDELDALIAGLRAEPARAAQLREQLVIDDHLAQKMTVDRRNFLAQVEQRIADFERSEEEIDSQVAELRELATKEFERPVALVGQFDLGPGRPGLVARGPCGWLLSRAAVAP